MVAVLLKDVQVLTLERDRMTKGRKPMKQLSCFGHYCDKRYLPPAVQCRNVGFDGLDVQWKCKGNIGNNLEFDTLRVSCEGYSSPNDPYIVGGSCGLNYSLKPKYNSKTNSLNNVGPSSSALSILFFSILGIGIIYYIYSSLTKNNNIDHNINQASAPPDDGDDDPPPPYPGNIYPDSFRKTRNDEQNRQQNSQQQHGRQQSCSSSSTSPWVWAGLGAAGTLLADRFFNSRTDNTSHRRRYRENIRRSYSGSPTNFNNHSSFGNDDNWHESEGYATTSRR
ncbi:hypothetical protein SNEBB_008320 [Seison nebaliae]|nr:hypothetical protein SNEBB_008320 [Seison nebaliae]